MSRDERTPPLFVLDVGNDQSAALERLRALVLQTPVVDIAVGPSPRELTRDLLLLAEAKTLQDSREAFERKLIADIAFGPPRLLPSRMFAPPQAKPPGRRGLTEKKSRRAKRKQRRRR